MHALFEKHKGALYALCQQFNVQRLGLFGSAATDCFDPEESDLDFVVTFADKTPGYASRYLDFAEALEHLFERPVDLVTERSIHNPYFRTSVEATFELVYDQRRCAKRDMAFHLRRVA